MEWINSSWMALYGTIPFAFFFIALAFITKGRRTFKDGWAALPEIRINLLIFLFDTLIIVPYVAIPSVWIVSQLGILPGLTSFWSTVPIWLSCVVAIVMGDYIGYWRHRLEHSRFLWPAHATHHSDRHMNWFSLNRMHPINRLTTVTIDASILALLGFPIWAIVANSFIRNAWGYFIHADLKWNLGFAGNFLISPSAHRWHHARDERLSGTNFATIFTFWDRMHKTYQPSPNPCDIDTGVEDHQGGFLFEIGHPLVLAAQWTGRCITWRAKRRSNASSARCVSETARQTSE